MYAIQPTTESYSELQQAFDYFNQALFEEKLPRCLITYQRSKRTYGYFSKQRFTHATSKQLIDEIAMNPSYFAVRPIEDTLSTLVHEMVHQWQFYCGNPGRRGYHNKQWAEKMLSIGLMPSDSGKPGGKDTGEQMSHYIVKNKEFDKACSQLLTEKFTLSWFDRFPPVTHAVITPSLVEQIKLAEPQSNKSNRIKYRCSNCDIQVWGKPSIRILCGNEDCKASQLEAVS